MKYLAKYKFFESIEDGLSKEDVKNVFESYVNWNLIYDIKDLCLEYLDEGLNLVFLVKYNISNEDRQRNTNFYLVETIWSLDLSHKKEVSSWHIPSDNIYELEPINPKSIEYFIYLRKNYDLQRKETVELIESILIRYPDVNINRVSNDILADTDQKRIVIGSDRRYSEPTNESQNLDLFDDCSDMFIELQDSGYEFMRQDRFDKFCLKVSNDRLFQWTEVKDHFTRAKNYLSQNGWELTTINLQFFGPYARTKEFMRFSGATYTYFIHYITEPEFIEKNKIYEIVFIFDPVK